jgi:hypothetical protein
VLTTIGIALLALWAASFLPLVRLVRAQRSGAWLANPVNAEYLMLAHLTAFTVGVCLLLEALLA